MTNFLEYLLIVAVALAIGYYALTTHIAAPVLNIVTQTADRIAGISR
jgi:hypothetical protein